MEFEGWLPFEGQRLILPVFSSNLPAGTIYDISLFEGKEVLASAIFPKYNDYVPLPENLSHPLDTLWAITPYSEETKKSLSSVIYKINGKDCFGSPNNYYFMEQLPSTVELAGGFAMQIGFFNQNAIYPLLKGIYYRPNRENEPMNVALNPDNYLIFIKYNPDEFSNYGDLYFYVIDKNTGYSFALFHMALDFEYLFFEDLELYQDKEEAEVKAGINPNPYNPGGTSGSGGGGGSFGQGETSADVTGGTPTGSFEGNSSATGMFTSYVCSANQLNLYADWLWGTSAGLAIARSVIDKLFGSPDNALIELTSYPFNIALIGAGLQDTTIFWGNFNSGVAGRALTRPYGQIDWGQVQLTEFWGNFLDYAPHTKVELYLPFGTGFVELDPGQVLPGTISVKTNIDLTKGTCVHIVTATQLLNGVAQTPTIIGCFEGKPGKNLPMTSSDWSSKLAGNVVNGVGLAAFGMIAGGVSPVASKGFAIPTSTPPGLPGGTTGLGAGTGLVPATYDFDVPSSAWTMVETRPAIPGFVFKGASEVAAATSKAINKTPPHISRNGGFSSSAAGMMVNYPYLIISRPKQSVPEQYGHHYGYPSNIYQNLAFLSGYTEIGSIHYDGMDCTSTELAELDRILKGGVIF